MGATFPAAVYVLCFLTSSSCAYLLARNYGRTGARLLMWSALCFGFLALNNAVVFADAVLLPELDLAIPRLALSLAAVAVLLFGFIWDLDQ
jgi:hypothetical protein